MTETSYSEWWEDHRDRIAESTDVRIDVFVRSLGAPTPSQTTQAGVLERLDELEDTGRVDRFTLQVWGDRLYADERCSASPVGRYLTNKIAEFERWADEHAHVSLPFESTVCEPFVADREFQCIRLPQICLAVYVDGAIAGVVPCTFDGTAVTAHEYLAALADHPSDPGARERQHDATELSGT